MPGDFVKVAGSESQWKHDVHSRSLGKDAIIQMVTKCYQNRECQNLPFDVLRKIIMDSIDIVVHVGRDRCCQAYERHLLQRAECENF